MNDAFVCFSIIKPWQATITCSHKVFWLRCESLQEIVFSAVQTKALRVCLSWPLLTSSGSCLPTSLLPVLSPLVRGLFPSAQTMTKQSTWASGPYLWRWFTHRNVMMSVLVLGILSFLWVTKWQRGGSWRGRDGFVQQRVRLTDHVCWDHVCSRVRFETWCTVVAAHTKNYQVGRGCCFMAAQSVWGPCGARKVPGEEAGGKLC